MQWVLLADGEIAPVIAAMNGRRRHGAKSKHQLQGDGSGAKNPHLENVVDSKVQSGGDAKLFRRIEAQGQFASPDMKHLQLQISDY